MRVCASSTASMAVKSADCSKRSTGRGRNSRACTGSDKRDGKYSRNKVVRMVVDHSYNDHARDAVSKEYSPAKHDVAKGGVTVPFPEKLHGMLSAAVVNGFQDVISWQPHGRCFLIHEKTLFVETIMPQFFSQTKLTSFQRQLNLYGFVRLTTGNDRGAYYHELFLRGRPDLVRNMMRTRIKGNGMKAAASPSTEPDFYSMEYCFEDNHDVFNKAAAAAPIMMKIEDDSSIESMLRDDDYEQEQDDQKSLVVPDDIVKSCLTATLEITSELTSFHPLQRGLPSSSSRISIFEDEFESTKIYNPEMSDDYLSKVGSGNKVLHDLGASFSLTSILSTPTPAACFDNTSSLSWNDHSNAYQNYGTGHSDDGYGGGGGYCYADDMDALPINNYAEGDEVFFEGHKFWSLSQDEPALPAWDDRSQTAYTTAV